MQMWTEESQIITIKHRGWKIHEDATGVWINLNGYGPSYDADSVADAYAFIDDMEEERATVKRGPYATQI